MKLAPIQYNEQSKGRVAASSKIAEKDNRVVARISCISSVFVIGARAVGEISVFRLISSIVSVAELVGDSPESKSVLDKKGVVLNAPSRTRLNAFDTYPYVDHVRFSQL